MAHRLGARTRCSCRATFYEQPFQDASLYFFDPTGRILVPEPVHVPQGQQLTTALVHGLLLGPRPSLAGVVARPSSRPASTWTRSVGQRTASPR